MKGRRLRSLAIVPPIWAALAAALGGCGAEVPGNDGTASAAPGLTPVAAAAPIAAFDVGEIKTAAAYLAEPRFAAADRARGEILGLACAACHTFGAGEKHNVGPNLHGVFGRKAASARGFSYSPGLQASGLTWTPRAVEAWLAEPSRFVPGTTMAFAGYRSLDDRRDLLAYLLEVTQ